MLYSHAVAAIDIKLLCPEPSELSLKHITSVSCTPHTGGATFSGLEMKNMDHFMLTFFSFFFLIKTYQLCLLILLFYTCKEI